MAMSESGGKEMSGRIRPYFFLSYAYSPTIAEYPRADPDRWVRRFFRDLSAAVRKYASRSAGPVLGFFDQDVPFGPDWKESLVQALGTAEVFVPLYSVLYLARPWPGREWACFHRRMEMAGLPEPERRFVPVLWAPLSGSEEPPGFREALALGRDNPGYAEDGLQALLKIESYRDSYLAVVDLMARRIVVLAEESPVEPSEVPDIDDIESAFRPERHLAVFAIETAVPASRVTAAKSGAGGVGWCPFPQQEFSLSDYASKIAERFDFKAEVSEIKPVSDPRARRPGIILIDPWYIANDGGRSALESAVDQLPRWVLPLLIVDQPDDNRTQALARQVREILRAVGALPTDSSRRAARGVSSLDDFVSLVRVLVAEAERQYLRYRSGRYRGGLIPSPSSVNRPRLRRPERPDNPAVEPDTSGEASDE
jgi:FxsC-like protein